MIKIGVSSCFFYPDPERSVFEHKTLLYLERDMARYLSRKKVMPILIPDLQQELFDEYLHEMDGFVLQGGADLAPDSYGEIPINPEKWEGDSYRDRYEKKIIEHAIQTHKPLLGICRGCQMINVYFGGTLFQDIQAQMPSALKHRDAGEYDKLSHKIMINPNGVLKKIYPQEPPVSVNTIHHQGIKTLGEGLTVEAMSFVDESFEAVSANDGAILGVQWHPEFSHTLGDAVIAPSPLFDFFLRGIK